MIGKPYFTTVSEAIRASQIVRELGIDKFASNNSQDETTSDDFYKVVQVSYDTDLLNKGVSSSTPVTLGVIPFTKLTQVNNAEADILNIQRNLDTISTSNVNDVINYLTGTLTPDENTSLDDRSQIDYFRSATSKLTAAYNAKAAYLTNLADPYGIETDAGYDYTFGEGSVPAYIPTIKITTLEEKIDWIESYLNLESAYLRKNYNISNLMQVIRNSFARKVYGTNFYVTGSSTTSLYVRPINVDAFDAALTSYFNNFTNESTSDTLEINDEYTNMFIIADSKATAYTVKGIDFNAASQTLVGKIASYTQGIDLTQNADLGTFSNLVKYKDGNKSVLPIDFNVSEQSLLQSFESADEYFLGLPLSNDKEELITRSEKFTADVQLIESNILSSFTSINVTQGQDLTLWSNFISNVRQLVSETFLNGGDGNKQFLFALLLTSLNDTAARNLIFKIMSLRDRYMNANDYVGSTQKTDFRTKAKSELSKAVENFINLIAPGLPIIGDRFDSRYHEALNESLGKTSAINNFPLSQIDTRYASYGTADEEILNFITLELTSETGIIWDYFFKSARLAESGSSNFNKTTWTREQSSLNCESGITQTMTKLSRDKRSFLLFNKFLTIIDDFPFDMLFFTNSSSAEDFLDVEGASYGTSITGVENDLNYVGLTSIAFYSEQMFKDLYDALTLTISGTFTENQFLYYVNYVQPIARNILQDQQTFYDGVDFVYRFLMQTSSLLNNAANIAYNYVPVYGEKLSSHYTSNAILNLNRQSRFAFSKDATYQNFSKDQFKSTNVLNGFLRYVQDDTEVSTIEDSLVVICGIPYGMLERLGAFNQRKLGYVDVTVTLRPIGGSLSGDIVVTKSYPISAYIEHQLLEYDSTINASGQQVLDATSLYELNSNRIFVVNDQFDEDSRKNELQSTALLNYIQLFYGLSFDSRLSAQVKLDEITDDQTRSAIEVFKNEIYSYRFSELVESRYVSTGVNSLRFSRSNLITQALGGCVFDKIVAIPIDAAGLKGSSDGYLVDILVNVTTRFADRAIPETTRSIVESGTSLLQNLQSTIRQNVASTAVASSRFNVRGST